ncbi:MAG: hypothetical protein WCW93_00450 [Candidatus Paceibacterota bacterium]
MMNDKRNIKIFVLVVGFLILGTIAVVLFRSNSNSVNYDAFATCLKDKGAIFYGTFWCPHCQAEKKLFGSSEKLLPYVECSTPDGRSQMQICKDNKIESYPTWTFADGSELKGEVTLQQLADKTSCILP